ncbi:hypothetical protein PU629_00400 [Pullulanibacillus sp. KACC 23026]|uniref:hypothetical protein n=1 Tax=Pullulanibacillus sp. KACC 23026 TaxID=3028315 RepID=UPI0023AEDC2D|nr:hypothetical protein [Pullulanibacillus sp. KACC 23026]WEG12849.1 hypothetical protein PU629_00400 [Pullulanibacillus sp. KACC 23026]
MPNYVVSYYQENSFVIEAIIVTAKTESSALENAKNKLISDGIKKHKIISIKAKSTDYSRDTLQNKNEMHPIQRILNSDKKLNGKRLIFVAVAILLISTFVSVHINEYNMKLMNKKDSIFDQLFDELARQDKVTPNIKKEVRAKLNENKYISKIELYNMSGRPSTSPNHFTNFSKLKPDYMVKQRVFASKWLLVETFRDGEWEHNWFIYMTYRDLYVIPVIILALSFIIYWILISIWMVKSKGLKFKIIYLFIFFCLNIIAYFIFNLFGENISL